MMRTFLFSLLLASVAATPAMAAGPGDDGDGRRARFERSESSESTRSEAPRAERSEQRSFDRGDQQRAERREQPAPRAMSGDAGWQRRSVDDSAMHAGRDPRAGWQRGGVQETADQVQQRMERRQEATRSGAGDRQLNGSRDPRWTGDISNPQLVGRGGGRRDPRWTGDINHPQLVGRDGGRRPPVNWDRDWRGDHRYDWRDARRRYGSRFHLGVYFDPFNWGYQRFQIGGRLYPDYYSRRYWINNPSLYSLPFPPPGTQWIRYYNDALLVDMWSGEVIDVIPNFFW